MSFEIVLERIQVVLHELLQVNCSIQLGRPQRMLCRQIS